MTATVHDVVVDTPSGRVRGAEQHGVRRFLGIPFAQPPVGPLRFRPPVPAAPWSGVFDAHRFAPAAMQPVDAGSGFPPESISEDCLALNVWAPAGAGPHPVLVWIHGGGQTVGSTRRPEYDGHSFARQGVVCVTVGYRLGVFGFLELGGLLGADYEGSGNNALRDLVLALAWVRDHIAAFGGDPQRVTLGGESAGAKNAATLLGVPAASGLFHRLVAISGAAHTHHPIAQARSVAERLWRVQDLQALQACDPRVLLDCSADRLIAAQEAVVREAPRKFPFRAMVDGEFLPAPVLTQLVLGRCSAMPALVGTSKDECASFVDPQRSDITLTAGELAHLAPQELPVSAQGPSPSAHGAWESTARALTAAEYWIPAIRLAERLAQASAPAWMYRFDWGVATVHGGRATHVSDLPFWWNNLPAATLAASPHAEALALAMHRSLVAFVQGGPPSGPADAVPWPAYTPERRTTLCWNDSSTCVDDPGGDERRRWDGLLS